MAVSYPLFVVCCFVKVGFISSNSMNKLAGICFLGVQSTKVIPFSHNEPLTTYHLQGMTREAQIPQSRRIRKKTTVV